MGDAHTSTYNNYPNDTYLKAIPQKYSQGYDIAAINGNAVKQILENAKPYYCYETEEWINIDLGSLANLMTEDEQYPKCGCGNYQYETALHICSVL